MVGQVHQLLTADGHGVPDKQGNHLGTRGDHCLQVELLEQFFLLLLTDKEKLLKYYEYFFNRPIGPGAVLFRSYVCVK